MKKDNAGAVSSPEAKPEPGAVKTRRAKPAAKPGARLPLLIEFVYTLAILIVLVLAIMVITTAILTGAGLLALVIRASVSILVMGGLLRLIASQISSGLLFAARAEQAEADQALQSDEAASPAEAGPLAEAKAEVN